MFSRVFFMIEGGLALELVRQHIAERKRVSTENRELLAGLDVDQIWTSRDDGTVLSVGFKGSTPADFTKEKKYGSRPKKGTEWAKRFAEQNGYTNPSNVIADAFKVPLSISYGVPGHEPSGWRCIGYPLAECGFLFLGADGPYAMWIPDVEAEVKAEIDRGSSVAEPASSFRAEFESCRRIPIEEWKLLVAQYELEQARKATEQVAA